MMCKSNFKMITYDYMNMIFDKGKINEIVYCKRLICKGHKIFHS